MVGRDGNSAGPDETKSELGNGCDPVPRPDATQGIEMDFFGDVWAGMQVDHNHPLCRCRAGGGEPS